MYVGFASVGLSVVTHPVWARNTVTIITIEQKQKKSKLVKCLKSAVMAKKILMGP